MTYVLSDIHGCYDEYVAMLEKINLSADDTLYILGDVIDRGKEPIKTLLEIMATPNILMLIGNHERMMLTALASNLAKDDMEHWCDDNGGYVTFYAYNDLKAASPEKSAEAVNYLMGLPYYYDIEVNGKKFLLIHAGIWVSSASDGSSPPIEEVMSYQYPEEMVWIREEFIFRKALSEHTVIFGHTPTIHLNKDSYDIWYDKKFNDKICIDGGCVYGGKLNCLRLDDMAEFSVDSTVKKPE